LIFEKILISVLVLLFLIHIVPFSIEKKFKRAYPFLGLLSNLIFLVYIGKKFFPLGENKFEVLKIWKYFNHASFELNISYIFDDVSLQVNFLIIFINFIFYIFCILKWNFLKEYISGLNFVIYYFGSVFSNLIVLSESFFQLLFLWPLTSLILLFYTKKKETLNNEKVLDSFYILEGISFFSLIISCVIFFECFNGSLSLLNFKNLNLTFIENNSYHLSIGVICFILPSILRIFFGQQKNINIIERPSDWLKFGFLFDILSSSILLCVIGRVFPVLIYLPIVLKFFHVLGYSILIYSTVTLFLDNAKQRTFLWLTNFFLGASFLFLGFGQVANSFSLVLSFLIIKNILIIINCEKSFVKSRSVNENEFLLGISSLMVFSLFFLPGSPLFLIVSELPKNYIVFEGTSILTNIVIPSMLSVLLIPSLLLTTGDNKDSIVIFLKSILNIPKNIIKLSFKEYFLYILIAVMFFLYMTIRFDNEKVFNSIQLNNLFFMGDGLLLTKKASIYSISSFYAIAVIIFSLKFYLIKKEILFLNKFKIIGIETRKRFLSFLLHGVSLRRVFNLILRTLNFTFSNFYNVILLKIVFKLPFKLAFQTGYFFNLRKGNGLVDSLVFAFLGSTVFLFYVFSQLK